MTQAREFIETKMRDAGLAEPAIKAFLHNHDVVASGAKTLVPESDIEPVTELPGLAQMEIDTDTSLLEQTVVIKLNGGQGTGMGLHKAKSLLRVRGDDCFLDLIARQVLHLREIHGPGLRFLLMDSFSTSEDTRLFLQRYPDFGDPESWELMQNQAPKLLTSDLSPAGDGANPSLEWCPPGHGDLYPAIAGSGWLDRLLADGVRYAFVSNSDNLGATLDPQILTYFAREDLSFLMEATARTEADRKGGHLARHRESGRLVLRESAQCPDDDLDNFQNTERHRFFNTNNLWIRLDRLVETMKANDGVLPLPVMCNHKTLDPRDPSTPEVYHLETAMGAGISCFDRAGALNVPRTRFAPVKTTEDLLVLRSDASVLTDDYRIKLHPDRKGKPPVVRLDGGYYKMIDRFEALTAGTSPSLIRADRFEVVGPVRLDNQSVIEGSVVVRNASSDPLRLPVRTYRDEDVELKKNR